MEKGKSTEHVVSAGFQCNNGTLIEPDSTSVKQENDVGDNNSPSQGSSVLPRYDLKALVERAESSRVHSTRDDVTCELWVSGLDPNDPLCEEKVLPYDPCEVAGKDPLIGPKSFDFANDEIDHLRMFQSEPKSEHAEGPKAEDTCMTDTVVRSSSIASNEISCSNGVSPVNPLDSRDSSTLKDQPVVRQSAKRLNTSGTCNIVDGVIDQAGPEPSGKPLGSGVAETSRSSSPCTDTAQANTTHLKTLLTAPTYADLQKPEKSSQQKTPILRVRSDLVAENAKETVLKTLTPVIKVRSDLTSIPGTSKESNLLHIGSAMGISASDPPPLRLIEKSAKSKTIHDDLNRPHDKFLRDLFAKTKDDRLSPYTDQDLEPFSQSIIYNVVEYFKQKKRKFGLKYKARKVASDATKLPVPVVNAVANAAADIMKANLTLQYPRFKKHLTQYCKHCGDVFVDLSIRRAIFEGYILEGRALRVKEIWNRLLIKEESSVCLEFLKRRISDLGFDLLKTVPTPSYIPLERPELAAQRHRYFQEIQKYRAMQRQIVYVLEADIFKVPDTKGLWQLMEGHSPKTSSTSVTVVYAARESGFIDGSLLCHSGDFRVEPKRLYTQFWLNSHLPKLPQGSVIVLGHSRHHFAVPAKPKPDHSWPRRDIVKWLRDHGDFSYSTDFPIPVPVLLEKVNAINVGLKFLIDDVILSHGHIPVHMPPNHRELNPLELVWSKIAEKLQCASLPSDLLLRQFLRNEFECVSHGKLESAFETGRTHEHILRQIDVQIDEPVADVIRRAGGVLDRSWGMEVDEYSDEETVSSDESPSFLESTLNSSGVGDHALLPAVDRTKKKRKTSADRVENKQRKRSAHSQTEFGSVSSTEGGCRREESRATEKDPTTYFKDCHHDTSRAAGKSQRAVLLDRLRELAEGGNSEKNAVTPQMSLNSSWDPSSQTCTEEDSLQKAKDNRKDSADWTISSSCSLINLTDSGNQSASTSHPSKLLGSNLAATSDSLVGITPATSLIHPVPDTANSELNSDPSDNLSTWTRELNKSFLGSIPASSNELTPKGATAITEVINLDSDEDTQDAPESQPGFLRNLIKSKFELLRKKT